MFKFSSTHIINSKDNFYVNSKATDGAGETVSEGSFVVGGNDKFYKENVTKIRKATPVAAQTESIKFTMPNLGSATDLCRLYLYIRSVDNADPLYANDWIYKGKPFQVEFKAGGSASAAATNLAKNASKWLNFTFGKKIVKVTADGADVTIEVSDDTNLRFYKVELQVYNSAELYDGGFETKAGWSSNTVANEGYDTALTVEYVKKGNSGFGTYMYLLKNLRLPTDANMHWLSVNQIANEMPAIGQDYVQYIITQCTERPEVQGISVVGQYNKSVTTHILWVKNDDELIEAVEEGLAKVYSDTIEVYPASESTDGGESAGA